ncbi:T9SS type A sorting domain-containing protein [Nonlabens xiamenensis]|uniref:T9SS type A sorting domain-containing protein n=1 Tax=Nonlabens xiamenensis TaxID=2341043 RepID=UPI000F607493|nr:T9SS type A sorting domain-containing protein [Nonlabens xiamenensis]
MKTVVFFLFSILSINMLVSAQSYDTTNFNSPSGRQLINTGGNDEEGRRVLKKSDGTILFGVKTFSFIGNLRYEIYCLNQDGTRCSNFGTNGYVDNLGLPVVVRSVRDFSLEPGTDRIVLAVNLQFESRPALIRLNADGSFDSTFGNSGSTVLPWPSNAIMNAGGFYNTLCLGNNFGYILSHTYIAVGGILNHVFYKLDSNGNLDTNFGTNGLIEFSSASMSFVSEAIIQDSSTTFLISMAEFDNNTQVLNNVIRKYDFTGNVIPSFGTNGTVNIPNADLDKSIEISSTGKIVVYGTYPSTISSSGEQELNIAVLNPDGSIDTSFSSNSNGVNNYVFVPSTTHIANDVVFQPDGRLIVMYRTTPQVAGYNSLLFRLNTDGSVDTTFGGPSGSAPPNNFSLNASASISEFFDMKLVDDGSLFATGFGNSFTPTFFDAWLVKVLIPGAALNSPDIKPNEVEVFPNPVSEILHFKTDLSIQSISIHDLSGRELLKLEPNTTNINIQELGLNPSVYFLEFKGDLISTTKKIIVK